MEYLFKDKGSESLESYFVLNILNKTLKNKFKIDNIEIKIIPVYHVLHNKNFNTESYGLFLNNGKTKIFITGDSIFTPEYLMNIYEEVDYIFHDCELENYNGGVHTQYHQLKRLPVHIRNKMYLYHYSKEKGLPNYIEDGFLGFVKRGDIFEF